MEIQRICMPMAPNLCSYGYRATLFDGAEVEAVGFVDLGETPTEDQWKQQLRMLLVRLEAGERLDNTGNGD